MSGIKSDAQIAGIVSGSVGYAIGAYDFGAAMGPAIGHAAWYCLLGCGVFAVMNLLSRKSHA